ncbi:MAG: LuxR family transcriptional regulator, partial [Eggerthellaceae bacterium]|nr:LuxR family transcriptional regulator [Eggerthellaceae bacterium]
MRYLFCLLKNKHPRELLFFGGYALYLAFSFMAFHSATALASGGGLAFDTQTLFLIAVAVVRAASFVAVACCARFIAKAPMLALPVAAAAAAACGFLVLGMASHFSAFLPQDAFLPWLVLGGALLGLGDVCITLLWARFSATLTLRTVYLFVVLSNMASLAIYLIVTLLPGVAGLPLAAVLFLVSVVFVKKSLDIRTIQPHEYSRPVFGRALRSVLQPIVGTMVLLFMSGLMLQISGQSDIPLSSFQQVSLATSAVVVLL